jgi:hypothetical protein
MAWRLFQWGSRGLWWETDIPGVYMAHIYIADGVRVVIQAESSENQNMLNVIHARVPGGGPPGFGDVSTIASTVFDWFNTQYRHMFPSTIVGTQIVATGMNAANAAQRQIGLVLGGDRTGPQLPADATLCFKLATNSSGRRRRGRFYPFPACQADLEAPSAYTVAYRNAMQGVLGNLGAALASAGYPWAEASLADGVLYNITDVISVDRLMDHQDRRLPGRGR